MPGRLRVLIGRSAVIVLVIGTLSWIALSIIFNPPPGAPLKVQAVPLEEPGDSAAVAGPGSEQEAVQPPGQLPPAGSAASGTNVAVHVVGAVKKPGVYELPLGSRVLDAVNRAGGLHKSAESEAINLAAEITDGQQIRIPRQGEGAQPPDAAPDAGTPTGNAAGATLNINTASGTELETLPGIGPALAQRIIDFRQGNGPFKNLAELDAVSGIGPALLAGLRDKVAFH